MSASPSHVIYYLGHFQYEELASLIDFMYYGEVGIPEEGLSRFLTIAEQFQVRGLVENVPKVGDPGGGGGRKRPRLEEDGVAGGGEGGGGESYQPLGSYQPPGLVCPRCRIICRDGPAGLTAHMAVCGQEDRPVLQVAPSRQSGSMAARSRARQINKPGLARGQPALRARGGRGRAGGRGGGRGGPGGAGPSRQTTDNIKSSQGDYHAASSQPATSRAVPPNLQAIGQKLGLAVSITSLPGQKTQADSGQPEIKQEPPSVPGTDTDKLSLSQSFLSGDEEDPAETELERERDYPGFEEEETDYENQFEEAYDGAGDLAAEYLEDGEDNFADFEDYEKPTGTKHSGGH